MSDSRSDKVWQSAGVVRQYLSDISSAVPFKPEQIAVMMQLVAAGGAMPSEGGRFLDIGCGDGVLGAALLAQYPASRGVLLDFSQPMLDVARGRLQAEAGQLDFVLCDYADPQWAQAMAPFAPFHAIVSGFSIHHQPDDIKRRIYHDIFKLLAPGGLFVNLEHVESKTALGVALFEESFVDSLVRYHGARNSGMTREQIAQQLYNRPDKAANILAPVESQCEWLRGIGYDDVDCYFKYYEMAVFGGRRPIS
ncbi:MAG: class I SAM-dependent methyltransferase [Chloroflexi bacterium]|nr:class I SAM-dependent methyltransferase [Chloroflexota bacterium]MCL5274801.1 class I SAM-dependent methyltransferase [Chloroflexota bacterium]